MSANNEPVIAPYFAQYFTCFSYFVVISLAYGRQSPKICRGMVVFHRLVQKLQNMRNS